MFYPVIIYYYPIDTCLFANERKKGDRSGWRGGGKELGGVEGEDIVIRMYYVWRGTSIFNKTKTVQDPRKQRQCQSCLIKRMILSLPPGIGERQSLVLQFTIN